MRTISQDTPFTGDTTTGSNGAKYVLLNKREETKDGKVSYVADGYDVTGQSDVKLFLHQQISDPMYFKVQRGEVTQDEWLEKVNEIKSLVI